MSEQDSERASESSASETIRVGALDWLASATGSSVAYCGGVPVDSENGDGADAAPKLLSYVTGRAETNSATRDSYVDLTPPTDGESPFAYFMDGSRQAWKIAEFGHGGKIWPIVVGQIGVALCRREHRQMKTDGSDSRIYKTILSVPQKICGLGVSDAENKKRLEKIKAEVNARLRWNGRVQIDDVLTYADKEDDKTNLAISRIQALMVATEKRAIYTLAESGRLSDEAYLIKDGSLEYRDDVLSALKWKDLEGRLQYVIGVSKSFNADLFEVKEKTQKQSAASFISRLKVNQRTQAFLYEPQGKGPNEPKFAIWYLRIRDQKLGQSAFDGVLKIEMQLCGKERERGKDSLEINRLSEALIQERNPVCFGADARWANHIYPVYVTEQFLKSGFLPGHVFRSLAI
jgi:hypothetical protein